MQHIDGVLELGHLEDAIFILRMDSNLNDSGADEWNRLPIGGRASSLNQAQLIANLAARCLREPSQSITAVSEPLDRLCTNSHSFRIIQNFYNWDGAALTMPRTPPFGTVSGANSLRNPNRSAAGVWEFRSRD